MNRTHRPGYLVLSLVLALLPAPARAQWPENGVPVTTADGNQRFPAMVTDGQGGVFIAWLDQNQMSTSFLQRIGTDGQPAGGWPAGGIPIVRNCSQPGLLSDGVGGVYVVSCNGDSTPGRFVYRVTGSGATAPGWPAEGLRVSSSLAAGNQLSDEAGGLFVSWPRKFIYTNSHGFTYVRTDWHLQRLTPSGATAPGWPAGGRAVVFDRDSGPSMVPDGQGGVIVAYTAPLSSVGGSIGVVQRFDGAGSPVYFINVGCPTGAHYRVALQVYPIGSGEAICTFEEADNVGVLIQRTLQRFSSTGEPVSPWAPACQPFFPQSAPLPPRVISDGGSGTYLLWRDNRNSADGDLFALRLGANGTPTSGWSSVGDAVCDAPGTQTIGPITADGVGGAILAWVDNRAGAGAPLQDIYAQRIGPNGPSIAGWPATGLPVCTAAGAQQAPQLAADDVGGAYVCWEDYRSGSSDIYLYRLGPGGPVPVQLSVASTEVQSDRVRIAWQLGEPLAGVVGVSKRTTDGEWTVAGPVLPDGTGRIEYEDLAVQAGGRYGYRLEIVHSGETEYAGEVWVDIPSAAFGLGAVSPNPSARGWVVLITLLDESTATLDLIDVQGRVVATEPLGPLGAGRHQVAVGGSRSLPAGVYTLRLKHAGRTATVRGAIVR